MNYPLTHIQTPDGIWLHGLFLEAEGVDTVFLHTHGTASNFYEEYFIDVFAEKFLPEGVSLLSVNNRGAEVYDAYQKIGCAVEKFEDCVIDLDSWMEFAIEKGYKHIILSGHSLGTEKVVYYMNRGKHRDKVSKVTLLAPATSPGSEKLLVSEEHRVATLAESERLIKEGKGDTFLPRDAYGGILPKSAESYVNFLGPNSELATALPFHTKSLELYRTISIPILAVISDDEEGEYTSLPIDEALVLMEKENPRTQTYKIAGTNHDFEEKEDELTDVILKFIKESA